MQPRPVIIEAALNGGRTPAHNPHVPVTADALVADALACLDAGAAVIHTHAPQRTSDPALAAQQYLAHYEPVLDARPDALVYPTIVFDTTVQRRIEHLRLLAERCGLRIGLMEPGSGSFVGTGEDGLPDPRDGAYVNTPRDIRYMADRCAEWGLGPSMVIFEPGFLQHALAYVRAGRMPPGVFARFTLCGGRSSRAEGLVDLLFGLPASPRSLDVYVDLVGDAPVPWAVSVVSGDVFADGVAAHAVERGGHLRVGLEDHAGPDHPTNVELVRRAVSLVEDLGHTVATPDQAADILGLRPRR